MSMQGLLDLFAGPVDREAALPEMFESGLPALLEQKLDDARERAERMWREMKPGSLVTGTVVERRYRNVTVEFEGGGVQVLDSENFTRAAGHGRRDDNLPDLGETVHLTFHGLGLYGMPGLYAWDYASDPKFLDWESGYRSRYRGEDGPFTTLPWERVDTEIEPYDYRRNRK